MTLIKFSSIGVCDTPLSFFINDEHGEDGCSVFLYPVNGTVRWSVVLDDENTHLTFAPYAPLISMSSAVVVVFVQTMIKKDEEQMIMMVMCEGIFILYTSVSESNDHFVNNVHIYVYKIWQFHHMIAFDEYKLKNEGH